MVRISHMVVVLKEWKSQGEQMRLSLLRGQGRPLVKMQFQLQWNPGMEGVMETK